MRTLSFKGFVPVAATFSLLSLVLGGCGGKSPDQTQQNINTFQHAQDQVVKAREQVGKTLTALSNFTTKPELTSYNEFSDSVGGLEGIANGIRDTSAQMRENGDLYFQSWDAELAAMTNADLKKASEAQLSQVKAAYKAVGAKTPEVRTAYNQFMDDCTNLKTFFDRDKTASGVAAASTLIAKTNADGAELQRQLDVANANLNNVRNVFTQMKMGTDQK